MGDLKWSLNPVGSTSALSTNKKYFTDYAQASAAYGTKTKDVSTPVDGMVHASTVHKVNKTT